jgi:preprotein translocase subunit SecY
MKMMLVCYQILSCGGLSYMWIGVSGSGAVEEANKMKAQGMFLQSARATGKNQVRFTVAAENMFSEARFCFHLQTPHYTIHTLNKYIPMAALLGGMAIGELPSRP